MIARSFWHPLFQWLKNNILLVLIILVAFIWSVSASAILFPFFSVNNDEAVYVLEAYTLLEGRLTLPLTPFDHFTQPRFVYPIGDKNVFMYTHVFPAFLALGKLIFGSMRVILGFIAAIAVGGMYALVYMLYQERNIALTAAVLLLTSPLFLIHSATYLPYTFLLMMAVIFWALAAHGLRKEDQRSLFCAGIIAGLTFWARPLNGVIIIVPVAAAFAFLPWKDFRTFTKFAGKLLLGFLPVLCLIFVYNHYLTGNSLQFPQMAMDKYTIPDVGNRLLSSDSKKTVEATTDVFESTRNLVVWLRSNLSSLKGWTFGSWLAWVPILYLLFTKYMSRRTLLLISFIWLHPLIFFILGFWDMTPQLLEEFGPTYSIPLLVPMVALISLGTVALFRKWRYVAIVLIIGMTALNWISLKPRLSFHYGETQFYKEIYRPILEEEIQNGLVFLPIIFEETLLHPFGYLINTPLVDGDVVYAMDQGQENIDFIKQYPDRDLYQFTLLETAGSNIEAAEDIYSVKPYLTKLQLSSEKILQEELLITNPTAMSYVFVAVRNGTMVEQYLIDDRSEEGNTYHVNWTIEDGVPEFEGFFIESYDKIDQLSDETYFAISVGFTSTKDDHDVEIYEYRYDYQKGTEGIMEVILPPEAYYFSNSNLWKMEDISNVIKRIETK